MTTSINHLALVNSIYHLMPSGNFCYLSHNQWIRSYSLIIRLSQIWRFLEDVCCKCFAAKKKKTFSNDLAPFAVLKIPIFRYCLRDDRSAKPNQTSILRHCNRSRWLQRLHSIRFNTSDQIGCAPQTTAQIDQQKYHNRIELKMRKYVVSPYLG